MHVFGLTNGEKKSTYQSLTVSNFNPRKFDFDVFVSLAKIYCWRKENIVCFFSLAVRISSVVSVVLLVRSFLFAFGAPIHYDVVGIRCFFRVKCLLGCKNLKRSCFFRCCCCCCRLLLMALALYMQFYIYLYSFAHISSLFIPKKKKFSSNASTRVSLARWLLFSCWCMYASAILDKFVKVFASFKYIYVRTYTYAHSHIFTWKRWKNNRSSYRTDFECSNSTKRTNESRKNSLDFFYFEGGLSLTLFW